MASVINKDKNRYYSQLENTSLKVQDNTLRIIIFCLVTTFIPIIVIAVPLYLRHVRYADVVYTLSQSDIVQINNGISTLFCQGHYIKMNQSFNAFQLNKDVIVNGNRKHIRLKKSMTLPDDTLEYWGFFLLKGSIVKLNVCARFDGSNLLVTKGGKNLNTCGLLNDYLEKHNAVFANEHEKLSVSFKFQDYGSEFKENATSTLNPNRQKRSSDKFDFLDPELILDRGINHGGNAINYSEKTSAEKGASSFENNLLQCYDGNILLNQEFPASKNCKDINLSEVPPKHLLYTSHEITDDGYYYYIFYSDNDIINNNVHAVFDIYKPTLEYANISQSKKCVNQTECSFPISLFTNEVVIVEVPTNNAVENNDNGDYTNLLVSTCQPRSGVYVIFPIFLLLFILGFAYM